jgi:type II secretory pathway predicted ATPase ExeA
MSRLLRGLEDGEGVLLLTGETGTGKTLLCHCLLERLATDAATAFLTAGHYAGVAGLLQSILFDLSQPYLGLAEQDMRLALTDFLLKTFKEGRRTVLVIDEAHHLDVSLLEEVRLWGNLEAQAGKVFQVVLVGPPALATHLQAPELASLRQRLVVRASVEPLPLHEAADYLFHHLRVAGGRPERILGDEAAELLARQSRGVPRVLNQVAHQALALASDAGSAEVDVEIVLEGLNLLGLAPAQDIDAGTEPPLDTETQAQDSPPLLVSEPPLAGDAPVLPIEEPESSPEADDPACRLFLSSLDAS